MRNIKNLRVIDNKGELHFQLILSVNERPLNVIVKKHILSDDAKYPVS